jgi:hypothetical protein
LANLVVIALLLYHRRDEARARNMELAGPDAALRDREQRFRRVFEEGPFGKLQAEMWEQAGRTGRPSAECWDTS